MMHSAQVSFHRFISRRDHPIFLTYLVQHSVVVLVVEAIVIFFHKQHTEVVFAVDDDGLNEIFISFH